MAERSVSHKVLKAFNFDGLIIETIVKSPEINQNHCETVNSSVNELETRVEAAMSHDVNNQIYAQNKPNCEICFNDIEPGDEVILENCLDIFCRVCLASSIIDSESDIIRCPSKLEKCDNIITNDEIRSVLRSENYEIYMINKLDMKLHSLAIKDENEFQSILAEFDSLSPNYNSTMPPEFADPIVVPDDADDYMDMFNNPDTPSRSYGATTSKATVVQNAEFDWRMSNPTSDQDFFIKQERGAGNVKTTNSNRNTHDIADHGAAGMWAQTLQHPSFFGTLSPAIKREPVSLPQRLQQTSVIRSVLTTNSEEFVCSICEMFVIEEQGVVLKNCRHHFCRTCLIDAIDHNHNYQVLCPMSVEPCSVEISDEEVQALLTPQAYQKFIEKCTVYLTKREEERSRNTTTVPALLELENFDYVENHAKFNCAICLTEVDPGDGLMLKNCLHEFCKTCLARHIEMSDELEVPCPFVAGNGAHCEGRLQDRELRSLINEAAFGTHLAKSLVRAEAVIKDSFHCQTADCAGWAEAGAGATEFKCPVCLKTNCLKCKAIHEGRSCQDYYYEIHEDERKTRDTGLTDVQVKEMLARKEAMLCPGCSVLIQKTTGCNHMKCSRCSRDFQWMGR